MPLYLLGRIEEDFVTAAASDHTHSMTRERLIDFLAGGVSGLISDFATHPVDTVRTRLWMQGSSSSKGFKYKGLWHGFAEVTKTEGPKKLFKGFGSVAMLTPVAYGLYFGSYNFAKEALQEQTTWSDGAVHLAAGFFANSVGDFAWTPMDVVKQREQAVVGRRYQTPAHGLLEVWREGGVQRGLLRGYWSNTATYGPFSALYFYIYERWKTRWAAVVGAEEKLHMGHFTSGGALAGGVAAAATAPIDLIKTRIQVDNSYNGIVSTATRVWREEGPRAFGRGVWARVLWIAPGTALTMLAYEDCKRLLERSLPTHAPPPRQQHAALPQSAHA